MGYRELLTLDDIGFSFALSLGIALIFQNTIPANNFLMYMTPQVLYLGTLLSIFLSYVDPVNSFIKHIAIRDCINKYREELGEAPIPIDDLRYLLDRSFNLSYILPTRYRIKTLIYATIILVLMSITYHKIFPQYTYMEPEYYFSLIPLAIAIILAKIYLHKDLNIIKFQLFILANYLYILIYLKARMWSTDIRRALTRRNWTEAYTKLHTPYPREIITNPKTLPPIPIPKQIITKAGEKPQKTTK